MSDNTPEKKGTYADLKGFHRAVPIILAAFAVFVTLCFFTKDGTGAFGKAVSEFLLGSFSIGGYFIPVLFALHAIFYPSDIQEKRLILTFKNVGGHGLGAKHLLANDQVEYEMSMVPWTSAGRYGALGYCRERWPGLATRVQLGFSWGPFCSSNSVE